MLDLIEKCFKNEDWKEKLKEMIPSYGQSLNDNKELCEEVRKNSSEILKLEK